MHVSLMGRWEEDGCFFLRPVLGNGKQCSGSYSSKAELKFAP